MNRFPTRLPTLLVAATFLTLACSEAPAGSPTDAPFGDAPGADLTPSDATVDAAAPLDVRDDATSADVSIDAPSTDATGEPSEDAAADAMTADAPPDAPSLDVPPDVSEMDVVERAPMAALAVTGRPRRDDAFTTMIRLDASASTGGALRYLWNVGAARVLSGSLSAPSLVVAVDGAADLPVLVDVTNRAGTSRAAGVIRLDTAPVAHAGPARTASVGAAVALDGSASNDREGDPLTYRWSVASAPAGSAARLSGETTAAPTLTPDAVGVYRLSLTVSGSGGDSAPSVTTATALPASDDPPTVTVRVSSSAVRVGTPVTFDLVVGTATGASVRTRTITVNGMDVPVDAAGHAVFTPTAPGAYTVVATVVDSNGNTTTTTVTVFASASGDDGANPTVTLTAPADGAVLSGSTDVTGTVADANLARYAVEVSPAGANAWREVGAGTTNVTAGRLATLVPSALAGDTYDLRVTAWDTGGRTARATRTFIVNESGEVGANRLEFRDLSLDLVGIPITVDRIYDSFRPREGEFGSNWTLSFGRVEQTATPGVGWTFNTGGFNCIRGAPPTELSAHVVTFRVLGQRYSFRFAPTWVACMLGGQTFTAAWQPLPGTFGTLRAEGPTSLLRPNGDDTMQDYDDPGVAYDPQFFVLTLPDGTVLRYHRTNGLVSARDPRTNTLSVSPTEIRHSSGVAVSLTRDARGRVTRLARPDGLARTYRYSSAGDLVESVDFEGRRTRYRYGASHRLAQIIDPMGNPALTSEYAPDGRVRAYLDALGRRTELAYDDAARTRTVTDRLGRRTVEAMDANGALLSRTDAAGRVVRYEYSPTLGLRSAMVDAAGGRTAYQYNATGSLTQVTLPSGTAQRFTYDAAGRMLTADDGLGHATTYTYSATGQLTRAVDLAGQTETRRYAASGALAGVTFASGLTADYETDARGYVTGITERGTRHALTPSGTGFPLSDAWSVGGRMFTVRMEPTPTEDQVAAIVGPDGARSTARYDGLARATDQVNAAGDTSTAAWNVTGQIDSLRMVDGTSVAYERDAEGQIVARRSASGAVTRTAYDPIGRPTVTTLPSGATVRRTYGPSGITAQTDPAGRVTSFAYDTLGRQNAVTFPGSLTLRRTFDGLNRVRAETTPDGVTTTFERDGLGRVTSRATPLPGGATATWRATWHGDDQPASITDPNGNATRWEYTAGALSRVRTPLGGEYTFERDALGVSALVDPRGGRQTYARDGAGNLTAHTLPSGARESFAYDLRGHRITRAGYDGQTTVRTLDAGNRPLDVTAGDGTAIGWRYNADGLRAELRDARGVTSVLYTADALPAAFVEPDGRAARYRYAPDGQLVELATPHGAVTRTYDAGGRLARVTDSAVGMFEYTYDASGRPSTVTAPDGSTETRTWEEGSGRLASVTVSAGGATVFRERYTYDAGGRVTRAEGLDGTASYTYDAFDRLTAEVFAPAAGAEQRTDYTYDAAGNLTRVAGVAGTRSFTYDADDKLTSDGTATYRYDAEGRLLEVVGGPRAQRLTWDGLGRLTEVVTTGSELGAHTVRYAYDADGMMASRTLDGVARHYLWDRRNGVPEIIEETDASGALVARNIPGVAMRVAARVEGGATRVLHGDRLGTVRAITGGPSPLLRSFTAYGTARGGSVDAATPYGFAGERLDPATGSYYLRARHYAPTLGRFLSPDPLPGSYRDVRSLHRYAYAAGSPTMFVDPLGTFLVSISISTAIQGILNGIAINRYINIVQTVLSTLALFVGIGEFVRAVGAGLLSTPGAFRPEASLFGDVFLLGPYTRGIEGLASSGVNNFSWAATYSYTGWTLGPIGLGAGAYGGLVFDCPTPKAYTGAFRSLSVAATSSFMTYSRLRLGPIGSALDATPQRDSASVSIFWSPTPTENLALPDGTARTVQSWGASGGGGPAGVSISIGSVYGPLQFAFAWTDYTLTSSSGPDGAY